MPAVRKTAIVVGGALALVAAGVAGGALWGRAGAGHPARTALASSLPAILLTGDLTVYDPSATSGNFGAAADGNPCELSSGFSDVRADTQVTVTDPAGRVVALGRLSEGVWHAEGALCVFPLLVERVPAGRGIYGVEVAHRGVIRYPESAISGSSSVHLTLG